MYKQNLSSSSKCPGPFLAVPHPSVSSDAVTSVYKSLWPAPLLLLVQTPLPSTLPCTLGIHTLVPPVASSCCGLTQGHMHPPALQPPLLTVWPTVTFTNTPKLCTPALAPLTGTRGAWVPVVPGPCSECWHSDNHTRMCR